jgi:hypothetical protein
LLLDIERTESDEVIYRSLPLKADFALALQPIDGKSDWYERISAIRWRGGEMGILAPTYKK